MIVLQNITKEFSNSNGKIKALDNVSLRIDEGEFIAVVGKSGSGKSTLLNIITGIDKPTTGLVSLNNCELNGLNESELAKWRGKNVGIVFQFFQLIPTISILENTILAMEFVNEIPKKARVNRALELLDLVGIADQANKLPATLSGGQQQRAAIARALANDPDVLVADEPTGNLDSKTANDIQSLFQKLVRSGKTVIVVTHDTSDMNKYDRVITIADGKTNN